MGESELVRVVSAHTTRTGYHMTGYYNGEFLPLDSIRISPFDRAAMFGDAVYEVIRSYTGRLFETERHLRRMAWGASELRFPAFDFDSLAKVAADLISLNGLADSDATVYLQVSRGSAPRSHRFPHPATPLSVFAYAQAFTPDAEAYTYGVDVMLMPDQRWSRCNIKTVSLLPNTLAHQKAKETGSFEALFVRDGLIMEGSHTSILLVHGGTVITPPRSPHILDGITRDAVKYICTEEAIPFIEKDIRENELFGADEAMLTSTTLEVTPIVSAGGRLAGSGEAGPITRTLQSKFHLRTQ